MSVRAPQAAAAVLGVVLACAPIELPSESPPPLNACPEHSCSAYAQGGAAPACVGGACLVTAQPSHLVLVISLSENSYFAPGRDFVVPFENLFDNADTACPAPDCVLLGLGPVLGLGNLLGVYVIQPSVAMSVGVPLNRGVLTALPVHATYRRSWAASDGASWSDAESLGLPLAPVPAQSQVNELAVLDRPGPNGGPSVEFRASLQPGVYERTISPDPPFDQVFPPAVQAVQVNNGMSAGFVNPDEFDRTSETGKVPSELPTFDITRAAGLDGWKAYLRDATTKRVISNVVPLSGTKTGSVILATYHSPPLQDALNNAELVLAPPAGQPLPTEILPPLGEPGKAVLPPQVTYPPLPEPLTVSGTVSGADGDPVAADLVFEARSITDAQSKPNVTNFEFVARTQTRVDPTTGKATYSVRLPPGQYLRVIRPHDGLHAVTSDTFPPVGGDVVLDEPRLVKGSAALADGRPLSGALVDAIPERCAVGLSEPVCLPREVQTTTAGDGSFTLGLDPGSYTVRVNAAAGTHLPWIDQAVTVGDQPVRLAPVPVPAPVRIALRVVSATNVATATNPITHAIVRAFQIPPQGRAVEVGRAITNDTDGYFAMYIAPPAQ